MSFHDAKPIPADGVLECDICVVGSGAAGITIARQLSDTKLKVVVLEAGRLRRTPEVEDDTFAIEQLGTPQRNMIPNRGRWYGGSTNLWFGRIALPDPIDFEARPWVPFSGWPIAFEDAACWFPTAAKLLDVRDFEMIEPCRWSSNPTVRALSRPGTSDARVFLWSNQLHIGRVHRAALEASRNVEVLTGATAVALVPGESLQSIASLTARGPDGKRFAVIASRYVLAAGGIENPRLLLASQSASPEGVGNQNGLVGRFYMDHPRSEGQARVALRGLSRAQVRRVALLGEKSHSRYGHVQMRLTFPAEVQRSEGLLNHSLHAYLVTDIHHLAGYQAARRVGRSLAKLRPSGDAGFAQDLKDALRDSPRLAYHASRMLLGRSSPTGLVVVDQMEQEPDPSSRLTIDPSRQDRFGLPKVRLDWRIGESTYQSQKRMHQLFKQVLEGAGITTFESQILAAPDVEPPYLDMKHPSGTTRMGATERAGVVDSDCRVFGVSNLYVAGSSVFPTVGHANPTLLIVALAARLADHLRSNASR